MPPDKACEIGINNPSFFLLRIALFTALSLNGLPAQGSEDSGVTDANISDSSDSKNKPEQYRFGGKFTEECNSLIKEYAKTSEQNRTAFILKHQSEIEGRLRSAESFLKILEEQNPNICVVNDGVKGNYKAIIKKLKDMLEYFKSI